MCVNEFMRFFAWAGIKCNDRIISALHLTFNLQTCHETLKGSSFDNFRGSVVLLNLSGEWLVLTELSLNLNEMFISIESGAIKRKKKRGRETKTRLA